jgi:peptidoglycan-associated lipoprotein
MKRNLTINSLIIAIVLLCSTYAKAQYALKQADDQFKLFNYTKAAELYAKAYDKKPTVHAAEQLAICYRSLRDYANAETWYGRAAAMAGSKAEDVLGYAEALKNNAKYPEAKVQYANYASLNKEIKADQLKKWQLSCDSAMYWLKHPTQTKVKNETALNSDKSDWGATRFNSTTVFSSDRKNAAAEGAASKDKPFLKFDNGRDPDRKTYGWTGNDYLRLYQAGGNDSLKLFPVNSGTNYHTGPASFNAKGDEMFFTLTRVPKKQKDKSDLKTIKLEVYSSKKDPATNVWSTPAAFSYNNPDYSLGDPFITGDGNCLYFVSDMPGGYGGTDIYYSLRDNNGNWGTPVNVASINTAGNERTPSIGADNVFYFSSDGAVGMGGLDVFRAVKNGNTISQIQNMGSPINTPQDDFAYTKTNKNSGFFASDRPGGSGSDDIYSFIEKLILKLALEGIVYDKKTQEPIINALVNLSTASGLDLKVTTDASGKFKFDLSENTDYILAGSKNGYSNDSKNVTTIGLTESQTLKQDLYIDKTPIDKLAVNTPIRLENIYYNFNKSNIRPDAAKELNKLIQVLKDYPSIWIELGSHTDSRGSDAYNLALSQRRADAAVKYIVKNGGIDKSRITAHGYGETRLVNQCANGVTCTIEQHQLNRRTEFTIVKQ